MKSRENHRTYSITRLWAVVMLLAASLVLTSCGGGGEDASDPPNTGGGYTLKASGGTLNDGSGSNGLVILATLRSDQGWGPTLPWTISISGPGISPSAPIVVTYTDQDVGSWMSWEWAGFEPFSGTYRATATDGTTTIYYDFSLNEAAVLPRPALSTRIVGSDVIVEWPAVPGAGSYYYELCDPGNVCTVELTVDRAITLASPSPGDYLVRVKAFATDRYSLDTTQSGLASPTLSPRENVSEYTFTFPVGGDQTAGNYSFSAAGGLMDYDLSGPGGPVYGFAVWTSVLYGTPTPNAAPAGNWNITVKDPSNAVVADFIYPAGTEHYAYWYYSIEPVVGTYTVEATYGTATLTSGFTIAATAAELTPNLGIPSGMTSSLETDSSITLTWDAVSGAASYYVSLWAYVWNSTTNEYEYQEVWGGWVNTAGVNIAFGAIDPGLTCYTFISAHEVDMVSIPPPSPPPARADMSENYYAYQLPFPTP